MAPVATNLWWFIEQAVYLSLKPITGHYGGIVIPAAGIGPVDLTFSKKGVLCGVATKVVELGATKGLGFGILNRFTQWGRARTAWSGRLLFGTAPTRPNWVQRACWATGLLARGA